MAKKRKVDETLVKWWSDEMGYQSLEERLAFRNRMRWCGWWSLEDEAKESLRRAWMPIIEGRVSKVH